MKMNLFYSFILSSLMISCGGKDGGSGGSNVQRQEEPAVVEATDGVYIAQLRTMNPHSNGFIPHGRAQFVVQGDRLSVKTFLDDNAPVSHRQSVHIGSRCPTPADDKNGDRLVDYQEALQVVGKVLVPLDGDLSAQEKGAEIYPRGTGFTYSRDVSMNELLSDLWLNDPEPQDEFSKLRHGDGLRMVGRVVLVHGTANTTHIPSTLATRGNEPSHLSIPVVCGVIQKAM